MTKQANVIPMSKVSADDLGVIGKHEGLDECTGRLQFAADFVFGDDQSPKTRERVRALLARRFPFVNVADASWPEPLTKSEAKKLLQQPATKESFMTKQTVSAAADNTRVLSKTKKLMKLVVSGVKVAGEVTRVKFVARTDKGGLVVCRTRGQKPIRISAETTAKGKTVYHARMRGGFEATAKTPNQAFARGVNEFWALG